MDTGVEERSGHITADTGDVSDIRWSSPTNLVSMGAGMSGERANDLMRNGGKCTLGRDHLGVETFGDRSRKSEPIELEFTAGVVEITDWTCTCARSSLFNEADSMASQSHWSTSLSDSIDTEGVSWYLVFSGGEVGLLWIAS
jgi:hypothetical protein